MNKQIDITGVVLTTDRLTLRPWNESDFQYIKTTKFETRYDTVENSMEYIMYHPERRVNQC